MPFNGTSDVVAGHSCRAWVPLPLMFPGGLLLLSVKQDCDEHVRRAEDAEDCRE